MRLSIVIRLSSCFTQAVLFAAALGLQAAETPAGAGKSTAIAGGPTIHIDAAAPRVSVNPAMYGVFFEEINHAGDGGIYAELVQNRDFESNTAPAGAGFAGNWLVTPAGWIERKWFNSDLPGWYLVAQGGAKGSIRQVDAVPLNPRNPNSLRLVARQIGDRLGVANDGYWGMNFQAGQWYDLSFHARTEDNAPVDLTVSLESQCGHTVYARTTFKVGGPWKQYRHGFRPETSDPKGRLVMTVSRPGTLWLDVVSLFPRATYKNRPNGLRPDIVRMLADLKPGFLRFPGGCVVEGVMLSNRFQWKNSIGDVAQRQGNFNLWGYYSTNGLGFHEYLQLCEDLGTDAMYVINVGMSCQARGPQYVTKPAELQTYVRETLDALEYAMGPASSKWGAARAANGHPEPFKIKYVEIGNENHGDHYQKNCRVFQDAIKARYPEIVLIANQEGRAGPVCEMVDHHYYNIPSFFFDNFGRYDAAERKGPKVYVGEYACNGAVGHGNLLGALSEAVFMQGMERNADLVRICSYAPLLVNVNDRSWPVNMIEFDSSRCVGRSTYHVQKLFACNRPDEVLRTKVDAATGKPELFALAGFDRTRREIILKVVNRADSPRQATVHITGAGQLAPAAKVVTLSHDDPTAENTLDDPDVVVPVVSAFSQAGADFAYVFKPYSLTILRIAAQTP